MSAVARASAGSSAAGAGTQNGSAASIRSKVGADLAAWGHGGGFSLHAAVRIEAEDRAGLERLLRYCARPAFASERLC